MRLGEPLLEVETDKGVNELESVADGVLLRRLVREGTRVAGDLIAYVGAAGETVPDTADRGSSSRRAAGRHGCRGRCPCGGDFLCPPGRGSPLPAPAGEQARRGPGDDPGNRPQRCADTGRHPRSRAGPLRGRGPVGFPGCAGGVTRSRLSGNQAAVARKVSKSWAETPVYHVSMQADMSRAQASAAAPVSFDALFVRAVGVALGEFPLFRSHVEGSEVVRLADCAVALAVSVEEDLYAPVLRAADSKTAAALSREIELLAGKARGRTLSPAEMEGGCLLVSNLGMLPVESFDAIVYPEPQRGPRRRCGAADARCSGGGDPRRAAGPHDPQRRPQAHQWKDRRTVPCAGEADTGKRRFRVKPLNQGTGPGRGAGEGVESMDRKEWLLGLYRSMVLLREFEDRVKVLFLEGTMPGTIHQYQGQEACGVGVCAALGPDDVITSTHRPHGHALARGLTADSIMAELFGKVTGCCKGKGGSMHVGDLAKGMVPAVAIVGGGLPIATGMGLAFKMRGEKRVAAAFMGDGATSEGAFHEALNMSAIWDLPVLWVVENNLYGASTHVSKVMRVPMSPTRRPPTEYRGKRWTATTCSRSTRQPTRRRSAHGPARDPRCSSSSPTGLRAIPGATRPCTSPRRRRKMPWPTSL